MPEQTPGGQFTIPRIEDDPNVTDDIKTLALGVEKRVIAIYGNTAQRDAAASAMGVTRGMFCFTSAEQTVWWWDGANWIQFPARTPAITSGAAVPANSSGVEGDIFFKI